ncbi:MAG: alpha/beta hydrolase [Anaerolineae bacterium]|nr:alpha/beta hydrolase [Anaerolineae bacterium]
MKPDYSQIHPELRAIAKRSPQFSLSKKNHWLVNFLLKLMPAPKLPPDIDLREAFIPSQDGQTKIRLRIYRPKSSLLPTPALLWLHGGGYVIGKPEMDEQRCAAFVREVGLTVVSVAYRLAPKHPFPASLDDAHAALKWTASQTQTLGIDAQRIAIGGNSAGAGLAAALAQLAHDRREVKIAFQLLVYPMLDDRTVLRGELDDQNNITWDQQSNRFGWESYLGQACGAVNTPNYAVPARRNDLRGLPPAWIGVGSLDLFYAEDVAYAQRLRANDVACELKIVTGAFHGFDAIGASAPVIEDFTKAQFAALRKHLGDGAT